ncbi:hypothetical protein RQP46_003422 [Phenoliferia psychrophenolica]
MEVDPANGQELAPLIFVTHSVEMSAVHRLYSSGLSDQANLERYGAAQELHGHTYKISVTFSGPLDKRTGQIVGQDMLADCVTLATTEVMGRKNLPHRGNLVEVRVKVKGCPKPTEVDSSRSTVAVYRGGMVPFTP